MGVLDRLRDWLDGLGGTDDGSTTTDGTATGSSTDVTGPADDEDGQSDGEADSGLDPSAVTETRSTATDDTVAALRDVRNSAPDPDDVEGAGSAGTEDGSSADDERPDHTNS